MRWVRSLAFGILQDIIVLEKGTFILDTLATAFVTWIN